MFIKFKQLQKELCFAVSVFLVLIATFMSGNLSVCYEVEKKYAYSIFFLLVIISIITYYIMHKVLKYIRLNEELTKNFKEKSEELENALSEEEKQEAVLREQTIIFDSIHDSIILHDLEGKFLYLNESAWKTRGYTHDEMMGMKLRDIIAPECENGQPNMLKAAAEQMRKEGHVTIRVKHICKNGERIDVEAYAKLITYNLKPCILKSIRDITQQLKAQSEIDKLSTVVDQIDDAVMITDKDGIITYVNEGFCRHTGYAREELLGNNPGMLKSGHHSKEFYKDLWKTILGGNFFRDTVVNKKKNGDIFYEDKTITPLKDDKGEIIGFVSTGKDVTREILMNRKIKHMATMDQLTGIYNRHKFEELFRLESERSRRFSQPLSLILIDIDHFKLVNDTFGHDIGDEVLKHLAKVVQDTIRKIDIFARWGGEEFLVLSPGTDLENIKILAEKLRIAVENAQFPKVNHITISLGISTFNPEDTFVELFKRVDQGLYYAKELGRNQVGVITS